VWNVDAQLRWLWVAVSEQVTFCDILPGRGFPQAASLLGADYDGWLTHDGWKVYYKFLRAGHQSCLSHLLRRCEDMIKIASPAATRFPLQVQAVLQQALALRDRYHQHEISLHGLWTATGRLEVKLDRVLAHPGRDAANRRLAKHLLHERPHIFTFLYCPGLDATNNVSERAIRALIGARKNWGGNRTPRGARAQAVLTSILQTAKQQGKQPFDVLVELLCCSDKHKMLDLVPVTPEAPLHSSPHPPTSFPVPGILAAPPSAGLAAAPV
jgi:transposase